jgi:hypothetical protein
MQTIFANRASAIIYNFIKQYNSGVYLLPANICSIVPLTFVKAGVKFEFIDICPDNLCINEASVLKIINNSPEKYTGIVYVHTYGALQNTVNFFEKIRQISNDIKIIDDRCLCIPEFDQTDDFGADLIIYSTGYGKYVDIGYGAFGYYKDSLKLKNCTVQYNEKAMQRLNEQVKTCLVSKTKLKSDINDWLDTHFLQIIPLEYQDKMNDMKDKVSQHKTIINSIYSNNLPQKIQLQSNYNQWRFNIQVDNKEKILKQVFENKLFASSHYVPSNTLFDDNYFCETEKLSSRIINLFNDFYINEDKAIKICNIINKKIK